MKKFNLCISIVSSIIACIDAILYYILVGTGVIEANKIAYLFVIGYLICAWIPMFAEWIFKINFGKVANITYQAFLVFSILIGSIWGIYEKLACFDIILHSLSGIVIAIIAFSLFKASKKNNKLSLVWLFILIFSVVMACGGLWEIWEFVTDIILNGNSQIVNGLVGREAIMDTMIDILCDFGGGIVGATIVVLLENKDRKVNNNKNQKV